MKSKRLLLLLLLAIGLPWAAKAQTVTIGTGTDTQYESPMDNYYNYSFVEMIYTADEIAAGHPTENTILSVGFHLASQGLNGKTYTITVYMKNIDATSFESASHVAFASTDAVTTKNVTATASGWVTIELDTPFTYDPTKSLLIGVNKTAGSYAGSSYKWSYTTTTEYRHLHNHQDTPAAYDPTTPPTYPTRNYKRPNVQLTFGVPPTCFAPQNLTCTEYTATSATLTWQRHACGTENAWVLQYSTDNTFASGVQSVNVSNTPSTQLTDLTAETKYYARVRPDCDENLWSDVCEFKPTNAISQTVCDGTTTNSYVPVYGNYAENYNKDEFIIPATTEGMAGMAGGTISKMTFYLSSPASDLWGAALYRVFMKEVNESSFASTSYYGTDGATIVYEGALDGTQSTMTIEFTTDYEYNGGNLLVGIYEYNKGSFKNCSFYGITSTNGALYKNNGTSLESITSGTLQNFIPKTTFTYLPCATPKPKNLHVVDGSLWSGGATLAWEAPTSATPTSYQWRYKSDATWTAWESTTELSVALNLSSSTHYTFEVKAIYDGVGESAAIQTDFTTLDDCAFPTNLLAYTTPGQGTKATLTWVKGYDEEAWVLQYGTDANFTDGTYTEKTSGFIPQTEPGLENVVAAVLTGLTAETKYFARVKATCSATSSSTWSNVVDFTPTNFVDYTFNENATSNSSYSYIPFRGSYVAYQTNSQFIIPATSLEDVAGGTVKRLTFYSATPTVDWGAATFKVYVAEVDNTTFASNPTSFDWSAMDEVYSGSLSVANGQMVIVLDQTFYYSGDKNLMIGFEKTAAGTNASVAWIYNSVSNTCAYSYNSSSATGTLTYSRSGYLPKLTFNYQPTPYQKIAAINEGTITSNTAELTWTAPETTATIVGYYYQYKMTSTAEWPTGWHNLDANTTSVTLGELTPGTSYDFRIKVLYEGNHESAVTSTSFFTECAVVTDFPWSEKFESYSAGDFSHPCWVNEHLVSVSNRTEVFKVYTGTNGTNSTHQLQLPDMQDGNTVKLRLPEMNLPNANYQFVIDFYRNDGSYGTYVTEGISVFASTDGEIEGATLLAFIPRPHSTSDATGSTTIPQEIEAGWYTYELPIGMSGTCFIILRGESRYGASSFMDNFFVEEIPSCARPTGLAKSEVTNHSATLTWTAGDTEQHNWQVAYSKTSFDPNTANFDLTTVETVDFTTGATCTYRMDKLFDAESTYYLYIRANCGTATEPDYGPWSRKGINLTTLGASPAPSNFTASNIGSQTADLVWTAGGGDYELSWDLYYVQSDDAPTAPTEETHATKTVTTLPTTENPYTLDGLREESRYYIWVRANHTINSVTTHSAWVALTDNFFTTIAPCSAMDPVVSNITHHNATVTWNGESQDGFTVNYRTAAGIDNSATPALSENFSGTSIPTDWTKYQGKLSGNTATLTSDNYGWYFGTNHEVFDNHAYVNIYGNNQRWLVTPETTLPANAGLSFDLALTCYSSSSFAPQTNGTDDKFIVLISTDDMATWTVLRQWDNDDNTTGGIYAVYNDIANTTTGENVTLNLSSYSGQTVYIAFYGESTTSDADNYIHIDNVIVAPTVPAGDWQQQAATTTTADLADLTAGTKYEVKVVPNCDATQESATVQFTTLDDNTKYFLTAGDWATAANWMDEEMPAITDNAIIKANATINNGTVAAAKQITFQGSPTPTLTIENGGQLQHDNTNTITATVKKTITGYGAENYETNNGYVLFAPPFDKYIYNNNSDGTGLRNGTYDLYSWSRTARPEWINYGANNTSSLSMSRGTGYLYANQATTEVTFTGSIYGSGSKYNKSVYYTEPTANRFQDWNLIGNPFVCNAYLATETGTPLAYYKMNAAGNGFEAVTGAAIAPMEGVFYQATEAGSVYFFRELPAGNVMPGNLNINLTQAVTTRGEQGATDNAIIRFGEGNTLGKFSFREGSSKVYIPMEGKDYAVVNAEGKTGEIPVNFKAEKNGSYTLSFTSQEVSFSYLHLIDNLTGNDVNLLANPSYSFDAQTTDYAQRFRLVFATGSSVDGDSFAFINGAGNLSIFGIEGTATVQVMDVLGHVLSSESFSGSYEKQLNVAPGVYMIRLINGNDVKVQKMIVK